MSSNAALEEGSEDMQEVDLAELKKLKVCSSDDSWVTVIT